MEKFDIKEFQKQIGFNDFTKYTNKLKNITEINCQENRQKSINKESVEKTTFSRTYDYKEFELYDIIMCFDKGEKAR